MEIERLRTIIAYSDKNREDIHSMVKRFCSFAGIEYDSALLNVLQIARSSFQKKGYLVFEMPFDDVEIGALCYKGEGMGYVVLNTSLPRVNVNFAIAHEIYHVFYGLDEFVSKVEFSDDQYYEHEGEYAANLFAGMLLMPDVSFRRMFSKFKEESNGNEIETIIRLMAYYQTPYMAVLIRSLELQLIARNEMQKEVFNVERDYVRQKMNDLWLDESIMNPSRKDDYAYMETMVSRIGKEFVEDEFINERTVNKVLKNMRELYTRIKGK